MKDIETERLLLRPFREDDLEEAHRVMDGHPEVWRFDSGVPVTLEDRAAVIKNRMAECETLFGRAGIFNRAVIRKADDQLLGYAGLQPDLVTNGILPSEAPYTTLEVELFYKFGFEYWGNGYATEACSALLNFVFRAVKLKRIYTGTNARNIRSVALMKRLGMTLRFHPEAEGADAFHASDSVLGLIENPFL